MRQLNMYNFHKVKGQKHRHVFRHPFFKRGDEESLKNIRRKHVGKEIRHRSLQSVDKEMHPWNQLMADKLGKLREVLDIMSKQNQDLVGINNRMVNELQHLKHSWQIRSQDLISLTSTIVHQPNSRLVSSIQSFISSLGFDNGAQNLPTFTDVQDFFNSCQSDQFKNEMNIFFVTEQLTSLYKSRHNKSISNEFMNQKGNKANLRGNESSYTNGSTNNNTSGLTGNNSNEFGADRHCNSVDDISQFDFTEEYSGASEKFFDFYCRSKAENAEFESFIADAFDSLSIDEEYLFTEESL